MRVVNDTEEEITIAPGEGVELKVEEKDKIRTLATRVEYFHISGVERFASG